MQKVQQVHQSTSNQSAEQLTLPIMLLLWSIIPFNFLFAGFISVPLEIKKESMIGLLVNWSSVLIIWGILRLRFQWKVSSLKNQKVSVRMILFALAGVLVIYFVNHLVRHPMHLPAGALLFTPRSILSTLIIAPVFEEVFYRGIFLERLLNRYHAAVGIIITAVLFALPHYGTWGQVFRIGLCGLGLGVIYYKTRSTSLCIGAHFVYNIISLYWP